MWPFSHKICFGNLILEDHRISRKLFSDVQEETPVFVFAHCLILSPLKRSWLRLLCTLPSDVSICWWDPLPQSLLFPRSFRVSFHRTYDPEPLSSSLPFAGVSVLYLCLSCSGELTAGHSTPSMASEELSRELPHLSLSAGNIMLTATKDTVSIVCGNGLIAEQWVQLGVPRSPRAFSATLLSTQSANSMYWCLGFLHLGAGRCPSSYWTSSSSCQPISSACPGPSVWQHNLLVYRQFLKIWNHQHEGTLCTIIQIINEMLKRIRPSIHPWGTPPLTCLQIDFVPLITTLCARLFYQFSASLTVCLSGQHFIGWGSCRGQLKKP